MPSSSSPTYTTINLEMILLFTQGVGPSDFFFFFETDKEIFFMTFFSSESSFLLLLFQISFNFLRHSGKKQHLKDQTNS